MIDEQPVDDQNLGQRTAAAALLARPARAGPQAGWPQGVERLRRAAQCAVAVQVNRGAQHLDEAGPNVTAPKRVPVEVRAHLRHHHDRGLGRSHAHAEGPHLEHPARVHPRDPDRPAQAPLHLLDGALGVVIDHEPAADERGQRGGDGQQEDGEQRSAH